MAKATKTNIFAAIKETDADIAAQKKLLQKARDKKAAAISPIREILMLLTDAALGSMPRLSDDSNLILLHQDFKGKDISYGEALNALEKAGIEFSTYNDHGGSSITILTGQDKLIEKLLTQVKPGPVKNELLKKVEKALPAEQFASR